MRDRATQLMSRYIYCHKPYKLAYTVLPTNRSSQPNTTQSVLAKPLHNCERARDLCAAVDGVERIIKLKLQLTEHIHQQQHHSMPKAIIRAKEMRTTSVSIKIRALWGAHSFACGCVCAHYMLCLIMQLAQHMRDG